MATIDNLDIAVYNQYAIRTKQMEQINREFRLEEAASIPPQTYIFDIYPKPNELDLLMGLVPVRTPWAYFFPPKQYGFLRRSPFAFSRIAPSFGRRKEQSEEDEESHQDESRDELDKLNAIPAKTPEEQQEKEAIAGALKQMDKLNDWLNFIIGRIGQFLQG